MNPLIQLKKATPVFLITLVLGCFALLPRAQAVLPTPDGFYPNDNTAEGGNTALFSLTTGAFNTAIGVNSMFLDTTGSKNTAIGDSALKRNTSGSNNTATGIQALFNNTTASNNTADGNVALFSNTTGTFNTATGTGALFSNTTASGNTADGFSALHENNADDNTAFGADALFSNTIGSGNTAVGDVALANNSTGFGNTAIGSNALVNHTMNDDNTAIGNLAMHEDNIGSDNTAVGLNALGFATAASANVAIGSFAGSNQTTGLGNVYIGAGVDGVAGEDNHTYIKNIKDTTVSGAGTDTVTINVTTGLLGHSSSSRRYKEEIKPMDSASETLYRLKPVTYHYKKEIDATQSLDYGLVAEDVAVIDPNLAIRDGKGQLESVRYNAIYNMMLNEFLKEHKTVQEQGATIGRLQKQIEALTAGLHKVSAEVELQKASAQTVVNNQ
jgi:hypothetical protein